MSFLVRIAAPADYQWIVELIDRNRGDDLTDVDRARRGFVQGHWNVAELERLSTGPGILLAEVDGTRAGVLISSAPGAVTGGPAGRTNELAAQAFGAGDYFLYGPVVVDEQFRGKGVLRGLVSELFERAAGQYDLAVAFVEEANPISLTVHDRLGFRGFASFVVGDRRFRALSCRLRATGHRTDDHC